MNIYIDGEIRILSVTKTLFEMITNNPKLLDIRGNHQLFTVEKKVSAGGGQVFASFDNSYVSEKSWTPPVNDINSKEEWYSYIKSNQPDFDNHVEKRNIFNQKQLLVNLLGTDMLAELISDDRQKKLDKLGV
jgi:nicotinamide mononucleotide adenylyltransferase